MASGSSSSRRAVLWGLAAGAGALAIGPSRSQDSNVDVVIVGAGAAGIAAGIMLKKAGVSYRILEAENRVGGRALTDTTTFRRKDGTAIPFDIGCAWIHAYHKGDPFADYSRQYNFDTQPHDLELNELYYGPTPYSGAMVGLEHKKEEKTLCTFEDATRNGKDVAASSLIDDWQRPMDAAATYMGPMDMAVDFDDMSSADFAYMADYEPNYLVREGYGTLVTRVAADAGLNITRSCIVTAINRSTSGVQIETAAHGTLDAKAVIVTVSMGVLQSGAISFNPPLSPEIRDAIGQIDMGLLAKIPLQIPGIGHYIRGIRPYDNALQMFAPTKDIYFLAWPWDSDLMVGFVGGKFGWHLSRAGQTVAVEFAKERLGDIFGSDIRGKVTNALLTHWATNKFTLGAYSAAKPGGHVARKALDSDADKPIYFAGEAQGPGGMYATCSGAYMSGANAALKAIEQLKIQTPGKPYDEQEKIGECRKEPG